MKHKIKDFLKCAIKNKFTLGGYIVVGLAPLTGFIEYSITKEFPHRSAFLLSAGLFSLFFTAGGTDTLKTYKDTREHIQETGTINPKFADKYSKTYCDKIGIELAVQEAGLENLIEQKN